MDQQTKRSDPVDLLWPSEGIGPRLAPCTHRRPSGPLSFCQAASAGVHHQPREILDVAASNAARGDRSQRERQRKLVGTPLGHQEHHRCSRRDTKTLLERRWSTTGTHAGHRNATGGRRREPGNKSLNSAMDDRKVCENLQHLPPLTTPSQMKACQK